MYKISRVVIASILILASYVSNAQGINFQGVARSSNGTILASSNISLRLSLLSKSVDATPEYVETKKVVTNAQGIFSIVIGDGVTATVGTFTSINWGDAPKFLKVEMDPSGGTSYISMGITQLQYVPYSFYSLGVAANNVTGVLSVDKGGTGVGTLAGLKTALALDKVNNTADSSKPISSAIKTAILSNSIGQFILTDSGKSTSGIYIGQPSSFNLATNNNPSNLIIGIGAGTQLVSKPNTSLSGYNNDNNTILGNYAGSSLRASENANGGMSATLNVLVGNYVGQQMGSKSVGNTLIGWEAARFSSAIDWGGKLEGNVAIGGRTLQYAKKANANVVVGDNTFNSSTNVNSNVAVGNNLGYSFLTGDNNVLIGSGSLDSVSSGNKNVIIGSNAISKLSGDANVLIGYNVADSSASSISNKLYIANSSTKTPLIYGEFDNKKITINGDLNVIGKIKLNSIDTLGNIAIGDSALQYNLATDTTGFYNTAIGNLALRSNTTGYMNNGFGYKALYSNISGRENTAIGNFALYSNTTGVFNIATGHRALYSNTTGYENTANGFYALRLNTTGYYNTSIGSNSLYSNTTGNNNVASGNNALRLNTIGNYNTALGYAAGITNTSGNANTLIGYTADVSSNNLSNSTALGYGATVTASNTIQLGNTSVTEVKTSGLVSTGKGFLPPKLFASERNAIVSPAAALIIFCKNCGIKGQMQYYDGSAWVDMTGNTAASALEVGTSFQGGVIGYFLQQGDPGYDPNILHGFIAATADLSSATWCNGAYSSTGAVSTIIGAGYSNTTTIVNVQGVGSYAAKLCKDYRGGSYSDWYLPSEDELYKIWLNRVAIGGLGDLSTTSRPYWSSTDYAPVPPAVVSAGARYIEFGNGARNGGDKFSIFRVRPIRSF